MAAPSNTDFSELLAKCAADGDLAGVARLLSQGADPQHNDSHALCLAAFHNHAECVRILVPVSDPTADNSQALRLAAINGHAECFKLLIPLSAPLIETEEALFGGLGAGRADIISLMLAHETRLLKKMDLPGILQAAISQNHPELESLLRSLIEHQELSGHLSMASSAILKASRL